LNAIEYIWVRLKELIIKQHPKLEIIGRSREVFNTLEETVKEA